MIRCLAIAMLAALLASCGSTSSPSSSSAATSERVETLVQLGTGYLRRGDYARAKEHLNRALSIDPRSASAHNAIGLVFQLEQEFEIAEDHFKKAIRAEPESTRVRNNYGAFLFDRGRYRDAIEQLEVASEDRYYEGRATVFENLAISYLRTGDVSGAERAFERAVALNPDQPRALIELAELRYNQGRYTEANQLYRRFQFVAPQTAKGLWLCVRLARVFDNANEEASCALALRNIFPSSQEFTEYQKAVSP